MRYLKIIILLIFFLIENAYAYLDPGSGSMIIQAILAGIAAAFSGIYVYWSKLKNFFQSKFSFLFKKKNIDEKK